MLDRLEANGGAERSVGNVCYWHTQKGTKVRGRGKKKGFRGRGEEIREGNGGDFRQRIFSICMKL